MSDAASRVATTARFAFHSNMWLNLSHYLYKMASGEGRTPIHSSEHALVDALASEERDIWDRAVAYYAAHHASDNIRTDDTLFAFKRWVLDLPHDTTLVSGAFAAEWLEHLNRLAPIYRERFWPTHDARNRATLDEHVGVIREVEDRVAGRIAALGRNEWPAERIRVDLSLYANWAGAYTTNRPVTHVVMSSVDIQPSGNWLELLFHEASHGIIGSWSRVGEVIDSVARALDREPPGQLWHAMLFYFSGRALQDELAAFGRQHTLYMVDKDVFAEAQRLLVAHVEPYVRGEISLEKAVAGMLSERPDSTER